MEVETAFRVAWAISQNREIRSKLETKTLPEIVSLFQGPVPTNTDEAILLHGFRAFRPDVTWGQSLGATGGAQLPLPASSAKLENPLADYENMDDILFALRLAWVLSQDPALWGVLRNKTLKEITTVMRKPVAADNDKVRFIITCFSRKMLPDDYTWGKLFELEGTPGGQAPSTASNSANAPANHIARLSDGAPSTTAPQPPARPSGGAPSTTVTAAGPQGPLPSSAGGASCKEEAISPAFQGRARVPGDASTTTAIAAAFQGRVRISANPPSIINGTPVGRQPGAQSARALIAAAVMASITASTAPSTPPSTSQAPPLRSGGGGGGSSAPVTAPQPSSTPSTPPREQPVVVLGKRSTRSDGRVESRFTGRAIIDMRKKSKTKIFIYGKYEVVDGSDGGDFSYRTDDSPPPDFTADPHTRHVFKGHFTCREHPGKRIEGDRIACRLVPRMKGETMVRLDLGGPDFKEGSVIKNLTLRKDDTYSGELEAIRFFVPSKYLTVEELPSKKPRPSGAPDDDDSAPTSGGGGGGLPPSGPAPSNGARGGQVGGGGGSSSSSSGGAGSSCAVSLALAMASPATQELINSYPQSPVKRASKDSWDFSVDLQTYIRINPISGKNELQGSTLEQYFRYARKIIRKAGQKAGCEPSMQTLPRLVPALRELRATYEEKTAPYRVVGVVLDYIAKKAQGREIDVSTTDKKPAVAGGSKTTVL